MKLPLTILIAFSMLSIATFSNAQSSYPSQTIRLLVPYAAGGLPDTIARILAQGLAERLKQQVIVENRPGGNGSVAASALALLPPDGYTFIVTDGSMLSVTPLLHKNVTYDAKKDFAPVALLGRAPLFLVSHPSLPVKSLTEFIAYVKANPGQINYGSSGVGSTHHISMEAMKAALKLNMSHIPFRGTGQSVPALLGGHVQVLFSAYPSLAGAVESKTLTLLATNGSQRSSQAPDATPIADIIPGFDFAVIVGILARAGTPSAIINKIATEAVASVKTPEAFKQYSAVGIEQVTGGPAEFQREISSEMNRVSNAIRSANIKID
jgi:tripartite-type tricarboxylate transporter receptor subunit TctC